MRLPEVQRRVNQAMSENRCLWDDCEDVPFSRGLCSAHYQRYRRRVARRTPIERAKIETRWIRAGFLLDANEIRLYERTKDGNGKKDRSKTG